MNKFRLSIIFVILLCFIYLPVHAADVSTDQTPVHTFLATKLGKFKFTRFEKGKKINLETALLLKVFLAEDVNNCLRLNKRVNFRELKCIFDEYAVSSMPRFAKAKYLTQPQFAEIFQGIMNMDYTNNNSMNLNAMEEAYKLQMDADYSQVDLPQSIKTEDDDSDIQLSADGTIKMKVQFESFSLQNYIFSPESTQLFRGKFKTDRAMVLDRLGFIINKTLGRERITNINNFKNMTLVLKKGDVIVKEVPIIRYILRSIGEFHFDNLELSSGEYTIELYAYMYDFFPQLEFTIQPINIIFKELDKTTVVELDMLNFGKVTTEVQ